MCFGSILVAERPSSAAAGATASYEVPETNTAPAVCCSVWFGVRYTSPSVTLLLRSLETTENEDEYNRQNNRHDELRSETDPTLLIGERRLVSHYVDYEKADKYKPCSIADRNSRLVLFAHISILHVAEQLLD